MKKLIVIARLLSRPLLPAALALLAISSSFTSSTARASEPLARLARDFASPPASARPWVYWFWLNGNISSNGITADLEAMKRVGIGGVLIMEVDQGAPVGPVDFMSDRWRSMFKHVHQEARRLGLEVNLNNDAGWNGSGGPWITPAQSMQELVWTEAEVDGSGSKKDITLAQPDPTAGYYKDIAVLAFPSVGDDRIPMIAAKAAWQRRPAKFTESTRQPANFIPSERITNLTDRLEPSGKLSWNVPEGKWTILRFGHTPTGVENAPAPKSGRGLECDKLSTAGIRACFDGMMAKLAADTGIASSKGSGGLVATHIDSWENGSQNWTARMREEFQQRRLYDLLPYLPIVTGRAVDSLDVSERFLRDLRQTVSDLVIENYAGEMHRLAERAGMRFTVEAYGAPCDSIPYAGRSDEPMGEFWTPSGAIETCRGMASAGHVYGKRIIGAESFTSADQERWLEHPAILKIHGDRAFCEGINRFVFHRYALQPWSEPRNPGMTMGPWGQHYERTQTWWEWTTEWHRYLARCQHLLRQGLFVADICYLQPETPPQGCGYHDRHGYDWDECGPEVVHTRMTVKDGRIVLPDGMSYAVLRLPETTAMTPALAGKLSDLVRAGATVIGPRPTKSPSLTSFPRSDAIVDRISKEMWGDCDGNRVKEHRYGAGKVVWGMEAEDVLRKSGVESDFESGQPLRFIHRKLDNAHLYFVANSQPYAITTTCTFRVRGMVPELWWPDTGLTEKASMFEYAGERTRVTIPFTSGGSVFVVFRTPHSKEDAVTVVRRDGKPILTSAPEPAVKIEVVKASYGVLDDPARTRDVTQKVQRRLDSAEATFTANLMAEGDDPAPRVEKSLKVEYRIEGRTFVVRAFDPDPVHIGPEAVAIQISKARYGVLDDPKRTRDVRDKLQRLVDSGVRNFKVALMAQGDDPAFLVVKTLDVDYTKEGAPLHASATDPETMNLIPPIVPPMPNAWVGRDARGHAVFETSLPGNYEATLASGKTHSLTLATQAPEMQVPGPWSLHFAKGPAAPADVEVPQLASLSEHSDPKVKYFSGETVYRKTLTVDQTLLTGSGRVFLDLGKVAVMAEVHINGKSLGMLWKPPYRGDATHALKPGENHLEIRVVNLWPNRLIGDDLIPEDGERNPDGTLVKWPTWLLEGKPSPTGRNTFTSWRLWTQKDRPIDSGLIGPVRLVRTQTLVLD